jgi:hypothetical protein
MIDICCLKTPLGVLFPHRRSNNRGAHPRRISFFVALEIPALIQKYVKGKHRHGSNRTYPIHPPLHPRRA